MPNRTFLKNVRISKYPSIKTKPRKSLLVTQSFATSNPYLNRERKKQRFECNRQGVNQTIHIRLDQDRGFGTERNYDYLTVAWSGFYSRIHGSAVYLPNELSQADWFDTESSFLEMEFTSDYMITANGFKFDILCRDASAAVQIAASKCYDNICEDEKHVVITNDEKVDGYFAKEISCLTLSDHIQYRACI